MRPSEEVRTHNLLQLLQRKNIPGDKALCLAQGRFRCLVLLPLIQGKECRILEARLNIHYGAAAESCFIRVSRQPVSLSEFRIWELQANYSSFQQAIENEVMTGLNGPTRFA